MNPSCPFLTVDVQAGARTVKALYKAPALKLRISPRCTLSLRAPGGQQLCPDD
jgi:hypothetical protein|tara:strand:- start:14435 stop:14593 length:159 start_codon:yes stop_codon:yes gene_type:complete